MSVAAPQGLSLAGEGHPKVRLAVLIELQEPVTVELHIENQHGIHVASPLHVVLIRVRRCEGDMPLESSRVCLQRLHGCGHRFHRDRGERIALNRKGTHGVLIARDRCARVNDLRAGLERRVLQIIVVGGQQGYIARIAVGIRTMDDIEHGNGHRS